MKIVLSVILILICILALLPVIFGGWGAYYEGPTSDHFDGSRFFNPGPHRDISLWDLLRWKATAHPKPWPAHVAVTSFDTPPARIEGAQLRVSYIGHATILIQTQGLNILTDPVWSERASPFNWIGPKRVQEPGVPLDKLPHIDVVLISHDHYDHMDLATIRQLWQRDQPIIVAPLGNDALIWDYDPLIKVDALDWHQSSPLAKDVTVHLEPAQHWSGRWPWDHDRALWGAYVLTTPAGNIYFAGDTGYGNGELFRQAQQKFGTFRLALLPIGTYEPRWFMNLVHMTPEEAVQAHRDLSARYSLAIHHDVFPLADEGYGEATKALVEARNRYQITEEQFRTLEVGQSWDVKE